jgi:hypothetical protein
VYCQTKGQPKKKQKSEDQEERAAQDGQNLIVHITTAQFATDCLGILAMVARLSQ